MTTDTNIIGEAYRLRAVAEAGPVGKRQSSFALYDLLGKCMVLAERCATGQENADLRALVAQQPTTGNRRYVERSSDEYILVCRFVFGHLKSTSAERTNACRYAHAMRQAKMQGIAGAQLAAHLRDNGGINALYLVRPLHRDTVKTKTLYLTEQIEIPKTGIVALRLRRLPDNRYEVLECEREILAEAAE